MVLGAEEWRTIRREQRIFIGAVAPSDCAKRLGTSSFEGLAVTRGHAGSGLAGESEHPWRARRERGTEVPS